MTNNHIEIEEILGSLDLKMTTPKGDGRYDYELTNASEIFARILSWHKKELEKILAEVENRREPQGLATISGMEVPKYIKVDTVRSIITSYLK